MDDQTFQKRAEEALTDLDRVLNDAGEEGGFESDFNAGALTVSFDDPPGRFVVSPNSPVRQIWVSANVKSYKLDWNEGRGGFVLGSTGQTLRELLAQAIGEHLGEPVEL